MTTRYEIKAWRKSANDKAYTVRLGSAWVDQKGLIQLDYDALPIPDKDGKVRTFLETPRERDSAATGGNSYAEATQARQPARTPAGGAPRTAQMLEDDVPF